MTDKKITQLNVVTTLLDTDVLPVVASGITSQMTWEDVKSTMVVTESNLSLSDVTTGDSSTSKHGLLPKLPNDATMMLDGTGNFVSIPAMPTGGIVMFGGSSAPTGYLLCNGTAISRTTYATLFGIIGTTYGTGDGSTTFNVPNLKGKIPVGYNSAETEFNTLGKTGGEKTHTLSSTEMPSHTHSIQFCTGAGGTANTNITGVTAGGSLAATNTDDIQNTGGGGAHNNIQPYITLNYIIKI